MEDCSKICMYVSNPIEESTPYLVFKRPYLNTQRPSAPEFYQAAYAAGTNYDAAPLNAPIVPNALWGESMATAATGGHAQVVTNTHNMHPSDRVMAYDATSTLDNNLVMLDSVLPVPAGDVRLFSTQNTSYARSLMLGPIAEEWTKVMMPMGDGGGHAFGYASCQWLKPCAATDYVGTACSATVAGVDYTGFCFQSDTGSLECGRLAALDDEYGNKPFVFDKTQGHHDDSVEPLTRYINNPTPQMIVPHNPGTGPSMRCPTGSPAKTRGVFVSKRPLIAGCMKTYDPNYNQFAEVHVPDYCSAYEKGDWKLGCMLPSAVNYDPTALQPGLCKFATLGCTDSNYLKYNPEATIDDGSCMPKILGCTVARTPYSGVNSSTPAYRSDNVGMIVRSQQGKFSIWQTGIQEEGPVIGVHDDDYTGISVINPVIPGANAMNSPRDCTPAIEGCMDSTMVNYNPKANYNSNTWCVPKVTGCMMPSEEMIAGADTWAPLKDGISMNYTYSATVNDVSACGIKRRGCMDSNKINYDPAATVADTCYEVTLACLNPVAVNYNCRARGDLRCDDLSPGTVHTQALCKYPGEPLDGVPYSPSPPAPLAPPGQTTRKVETVNMKLESSLSVDALAADMAAVGVSIVQGLKDTLGGSFSRAEMASVEIWLNQILPKPVCRKGAFVCANSDCSTFTTVPTCPEGQCTCPASSGRRLQTDELKTELETSFISDSAAGASNDAAALSAALTSTQAAGDIFLANVPAVANSITAVGEVTTETKTIVVDEKDDDDNAAVIGGAVAGAVVGLALIGGGAYFYMKKKKGTYAKTVVPA